MDYRRHASWGKTHNKQKLLKKNLLREKYCIYGQNRLLYSACIHAAFCVLVCILGLRQQSNYPAQFGKIRNWANGKTPHIAAC